MRIEKVNHFEDFEVGDTFTHHWGRTIGEGDNTLFSTLTINCNPLYFNEEYAAEYGHDNMVINPMLAFDTVFGLSVQDLSEVGGAFLSVESLEFHEDIYPGDTIYAESEVIAVRESNSRPHQGIVTWHTEGIRNEEVVLEFDRTNLVDKRNPPAEDA